MSILGTGRNNLDQADYASKQSTALSNSLAQNNAGLKIADNSAKQSMRGQALGGAASMGLSAYGAAPAATTAAGGFMASSIPSATAGGLGSITGSAGSALITPTLSSTAAGGAGFAGLSGGTGITAGTTAATTATTEAAAAGGAAAGGAAAGAGAMAAIPYVGWAAAAGMLAYSLFS